MHINWKYMIAKYFIRKEMLWSAGIFCTSDNNAQSIPYHQLVKPDRPIVILVIIDDMG